MSISPLTVTDAAGANTRHAIGVHIVLINDDGRILLGRRARGLTLAGGLWSTPCGNLEVEPAPNGAAREAHEELGIVIDPAALEFRHVIHFVNDEGFGPAFALFFLARAWSGTPTICEPDKCEQLGWFPFDGMPEPIVPYVANALTEIRTGMTTEALKTGFSLLGWPTHPEHTRAE